MDLLFLKVADLELDVIARTAVLNRLLLVVGDAKDLAWHAARLQAQLVSEADGTLLNLTENDAARSILHLVENWDAKRSLCIAVLCRQTIEDVDECGAIIPAANVGADGVDDVSTSQTRDRHPEEVVLRVAALEEEGRKALTNLIPTRFLPADSSLVHFVHDNNNLADTETPRKLDVLTSLTVLIEASFELTTSS